MKRRTSASNGRPRQVRVWLVVLTIVASLLSVRASDPLGAFEQANKLYEQGKFAEAAAAYEQLIAAGQGAATLYFNLGNAHFKAGQLGRAIAAYRKAEQLEPRDPNLRFNLRFVRQQVTGSGAPPPETWHRWLARLTLNEWAALAMCAWWLWLALLALREIRPGLRKTLSGYTAMAGVAAVFLGGSLGAAAYSRSHRTGGVVVVAQAVVRYGPLEESQVAFQLRDGSEVDVLDAKELNAQTGWLRVRDAGGRAGWLKRDQVVVLNQP